MSPNDKRMTRVKRHENLRYPHTVRIVRVTPGSAPGNPFAEEGAGTEEKSEVLYEGRGRSYTDTTTEGNGVVDLNKRKASIPVRFDGWGEGKFPLDGDTISVTVGNHRECGIVKDAEGDNDRTVVYWNLRRV